MSQRVTRIAHFSDVHALAYRPGRTRAPGWSVRLLSLGRPIDAALRVEKLKRALAAAKRSGADHYVVSGDLTESGTMEEYESFAETLHDSGVEPEAVTLVPGNHDAYASNGGWKRAVEGPLRAFADSGAAAAGKVVECGSVNFLPLDVSIHQPITRSIGELTDDDAGALERRLADPALSKEPLVVVQHHPPYAHKNGAWQWVDGLRGHARLMALLEKHRHVNLLHGHLHHAVDHPFEGDKPRIFGAPAVVEDDHATSPVRLYDVRDGALEPAGAVC